MNYHQRLSQQTQRSNIFLIFTSCLSQTKNVNALFLLVFSETETFESVLWNQSHNGFPHA